MEPKDVVLTQIQHYAAYHVQKETMTWTAATVFVGGAAVLVAADPFWARWSSFSFLAFLTVLILTAAFAAMFVHHQFRRRRTAAHYIHALGNVATRWVSAPPQPEDLRTVKMEHFTSAGQLALSAISQEFDQLMKGDTEIWWDRVLTFVVMGLWAAAAIIRVWFTWACPTAA